MDIILWSIVIFGYALSIFLIFKTFVFALSLFNEVPFVASHKEIALRGLKELEIKNQDRFIDIGSGDGKVVFLANSNFHAKSFEGIEFSKALVLQSNIMRMFFKNRANISFHNADAFVYNYSQYTKVFLYMTTEITSRLLNKLEKELPRGSKVVSVVFSMGEFMNNHDVVIKEVKQGKKLIKIYIWEKK